MSDRFVKEVGGLTPLWCLQPPSFHWPTTILVKNSQKYIADPSSVWFYHKLSTVWVWPVTCVPEICWKLWLETVQYAVLKVWMDGHGRRPGTYFQHVLASSHFWGHFGGILESVQALLIWHFKHWQYVIDVESFLMHYQHNNYSFNLKNYLDMEWCFNTYEQICRFAWFERSHPWHGWGVSP